MIPEGVTEIGYQTFGLCEKLASVTLPNTLISIDGGAFFGCISLSSINLPANLKEMNGVFRESGLSSFPNPWPAGVTIISQQLFGESKLRGEVVIPEGVTRIEYKAFENTDITSVTLPSTIRNIGSLAFRGCSSLTTVIIPESVQSINFESDVFFGVSNLNLASQATLRKVGYRF